MKARLLAAALVFLGSGALRGQEEAWEELIDPETAEERVENSTLPYQEKLTRRRRR